MQRPPPLFRFSSSSLACAPSNRYSSRSFLLVRRLSFALVGSAGMVFVEEKMDEVRLTRFLFRTKAASALRPNWTLSSNLDGKIPAPKGLIPARRPAQTFCPFSLDTPAPSPAGKRGTHPSQPHHPLANS